MESTHQQAQPEVLPMQPPTSRQHATGNQPPSLQRSSCRRWTTATISALVIAGLAVGMYLAGPEEATDEVPVEDPDLELSSDDVLLRQFQAQKPPKQRLALHLSLGRVLLGEGRLAEAATHCSEALKLSQTSGEQAQVRYVFGRVLLRQGRLSAARELLKVAVGYVDENTDVDVLHALADVRAEMGHSEAAINLYKRAYNWADERLDHDRAALLAADMSEAQAGKGQLQESASWLQTASKILEFARYRAAGIDDVVAAKVASRLGSLQHRLGAHMAAMELYRKASRAQKQLLHPSHPDLVTSQLGMARVLRDVGEHLAARREIEAVEKTLREGTQEGLDLSRVLISKAEILRAANETQAAEETIQEAIGLQNAHFQEEEHPDVAIALSSYGSILQDSGKSVEAQEKYTKALEISRNTYGDMHPGTAAAHNSLGAFYEDLGDDGTSHEHFSKCLEIQLETLATDSPDVLSTYNSLVTVLVRQGRNAEAEELLRQVLHVLDQAGVPGDSPERAAYQQILELVLSAGYSSLEPSASGAATIAESEL